MRAIDIAFLSLILVTGCSQQNPQANADSSDTSLSSGNPGVLSTLRPHLTDTDIARMKQDEISQMKARQQQLSAGAATRPSATFSTQAGISSLSNIGKLQTTSTGAGSSTSCGAGHPIITEAVKIPVFPYCPFSGGPATIATYGAYSGSIPPPPPGIGGPGLVPPPPAVSLQTQAQIAPYGVSADPYNNPYASSTLPAHPPGSLFGSGAHAPDSSGATGRSKSSTDLLPITPTGMDARSAYKQRDDLRVLLKGALSTSSVKELLSKDKKAATSISTLDVGLPAESSKGALDLTKRRVDSLFKGPSLDKRCQAPIKKLEGDLAQAYYRYLYSYNKFALSQQTVAARKQEMDTSDSAAERQRAAADLSASRVDADSARQDMSSAQTELSSVCGVQAARTIIGRITGVTPTIESLNQGLSADVDQSATSSKAKHWSAAGLLGIFGRGHDKAQETVGEPGDKTPKMTHSEKAKRQPTKDRSPALATLASPPKSISAKTDHTPAPAQSNPITFQLKNVSITPRKSVLKVAIRNNGSGNFSFDPERMVISEGQRKLSEATVRSEFDTTLVQPNQEITGTITLFGRPWSSRLTVSISEGGKNIPLKR